MIKKYYLNKYIKNIKNNKKNNKKYKKKKKEIIHHHHQHMVLNENLP